jgi:hypothetical protein
MAVAAFLAGVVPAAGVPIAGVPIAGAPIAGAALRAADWDARAALRSAGSPVVAPGRDAGPFDLSVSRGANRPSGPRGGAPFGAVGISAVAVAGIGFDGVAGVGVALGGRERPVVGSDASGRRRRWRGVAGDGMDVGESNSAGSGVGVT